MDDHKAKVEKEKIQGLCNRCRRDNLCGKVCQYTPIDLTESRMVGKWFLSFDGKESNMCWQGQVVGVELDRLLVQLYSQIDGCVTNQQFVDPDDTKYWKFFPTDEAMREQHVKETRLMNLREAKLAQDTEPIIARIQVKILNVLTSRGPLNRSELMQFTNAHRSGLSSFMAAMDNLCRSGEISITSDGQVKHMRRLTTDT